MMKKDSIKNAGQDSFHAKTAFYLSLGFWIPLFNVGICIVSIMLAFKALRYADKNPQKYSGIGYAIAALVLSITSLLFTLAFGIMYMVRRITCENLPPIF